MIHAIITIAVLGMSVNSKENIIRHDWTKEWTSWAPRAEISPRFAVDPAGGLNGNGALKIEGGGDAAAWGSWRKTAGGIHGGKFYRFTAHFRAKGVTNPQQHISARVTWLSDKGETVRPADFILNGEKEGEWTLCEQTIEAPAGSKSALIELALAWSPRG